MKGQYVIQFYDPIIARHEHNMRILSRVKGCDVRGGTEVTREDMRRLQQELVDLFVIEGTTRVPREFPYHPEAPSDALRFAEYLRDGQTNHVNHEANVILLSSSLDEGVRQSCTRMGIEFVAVPCDNEVLREIHILKYLPPSKA
jgi:hypothetical protein